MEKNKTYNSKGVVLGNYWGGGGGSYSCIKLNSEISKEDLIEQNEKALNNGSLDSGMGYESLIGALLEITETITVIIDDKTYSSEESELHFIGNLTEKQEDFLENVLLNN